MNTKTKTCMGNAIAAADHVVNLIAQRLQYDLDSLYEQLSEIEHMKTYESISEAEQVTLDKLRHKIKSLDPGCPETMPEFKSL